MRKFILNFNLFIDQFCINFIQFYHNKMSSKRKAKGNSKAPEPKKTEIKYEEIDPNN